MTLVDVSIQETGKVLVHSSAVSYKNKGYLFLGGSNSGKTTLAMLFCRKYGAKFISSDMTVIARRGQQCFIGEGNALINLRAYSLKMTDPMLYDKVFQDQVGGKKQIDAQIYLELEEKIPVKCDYLILANTFLDTMQVNVRFLELKDLLLSKARVFNQISETIRGNKYLLYDNQMNIFEEQLQYMDTPVFQKMRIEILECLFSNTIGVYSEGRPELVLDEIINL